MWSVRTRSPSKERRGRSLVRIFCGGRAVASGLCRLCFALGPACPRALPPFSMPRPSPHPLVHLPPRTLCRHASILTCPWIPLIHQDTPIPSFLRKPSLASAPEPDWLSLSRLLESCGHCLPLVLSGRHHDPLSMWCALAQCRDPLEDQDCVYSFFSSQGGAGSLLSTRSSQGIEWLNGWWKWMSGVHGPQRVFLSRDAGEGHVVLGFHFW